MDKEGLIRILDELRMAGSDYRTVEAKRATRSLPSTTAESINAFANTNEGGLLLLVIISLVHSSTLPSH
jgi:ATP-dependent DNA helicase RecG